MSLEELQDYALSLEQQVSSKDEELIKVNSSLAEVNDLNRQLQKRNNELFMRVEQQPTPQATPVVEPDTPSVSCEEMAQNIFREVIK